jgi:Uma2 family endonuclease
MVDAASPRLITADQLFQMPDDGNRYELVRGRMVRVDPAGSKSSVVTRRIGTPIDVYIMRDELGICGDADWGFKLASDPDIVRAPDVGFLRAARIPADGVPRGFWPGAPDLAVEVISPSDRMVDVLE